MGCTWGVGGGGGSNRKDDNGGSGEYDGDGLRRLGIPLATALRLVWCSASWLYHAARAMQLFLERMGGVRANQLLGHISHKQLRYQHNIRLLIPAARYIPRVLPRGARSITREFTMYHGYSVARRHSALESVSHDSGFNRTLVPLY